MSNVKQPCLFTFLTIAVEIWAARESELIWYRPTRLEADGKQFKQLYCIVFIHFYSASHSLSLSEALPTTAIDTVSEFTRRSATGNCRQRTCPRSLAYMAARVGFEPTTLRSNGVVSTNAPPCPMSRPNHSSSINSLTLYYVPRAGKNLRFFEIVGL